MMQESLENFNSILRLSCAKIVNGRHRRGGANLHKNLLVLTVIGKVQVAKNKLEAMKAQATILMMETDQQEDYVPPVTTKSQDPAVLSELEDEDDEEDEDISPPLEFSVTDSSSETEKISEEVVFASEAVEDADSALRDRKRKSDARQVIPRSKSQRVASGDRCVPAKC